jgi:hypothetical protein
MKQSSTTIRTQYRIEESKDMKLTKSQRHNRRTHAKRQAKIRQYLLDRQKEEMHPLPADIAAGLGDIAPGEMLTAREYLRCLERLAAIRAGGIKKSTRNERLGIK